MTANPAQHARRLNLACMIAAAVLVGLAVTLAAPFRVADCGPADPHLLRYLGGPFLHSTGTGIPASMEARIWAGPFFGNVALIAALVFGLQVIAPGLPRRPVVLWICLVVAVVMTLVLLSITLNVNDMQWTVSGPPISAEVCDTRFEFSPDHRAWQPVVTP
jgi:hypothetical protein